MTTAVLDQLDGARSIAARGGQAIAMQRQAHAVGGCERPVRIAGHGRRVDTTTGEIVGNWSTEDLPDGVLHVRCKIAVRRGVGRVRCSTRTTPTS